MEELQIAPDKTTVVGYRKYIYENIDTRTGELIAQGFTYDTKTFSMSSNAQNNLLGTFAAKDALDYPFSWNVKDDSETYSIADITEMTTFFMTALATKKGHQDSGTVLKSLVTAATTIEELELIIDER